MNAKRDLLIVILLLSALGLAWYYAGGPGNSLARSSPFLTLPGYGTGTPAYIVPSVQYTPPKPIGSSQSQSNNPSFTNYLGTFNETASPYAKYVTLERGVADSGYQDEYVVIRIAYDAPQKITVTGWRLESTATNLGTTLPLGSPLPFLGSVNATGPVSMGAGESAYVVTSRSPVGTSFRTNMCTGYFEQYQNFKPALRLECPSPDDEANRVLATGNYNDDCYNVVRSISRCTLSTATIPYSAGSQCQSLVQDTLTYNGCINAHKSDPKFYKDVWYLYLNRDQELWANRSERIRLVDETGKVVSAISY